MIKSMPIFELFKRCTRTKPFQYVIRLLVQLTVAYAIYGIGSGILGLVSDGALSKLSYGALLIFGFAGGMAVLPIWEAMNINSKLWGYDALEPQVNESEF